MNKNILPVLIAGILAVPGAQALDIFAGIQYEHIDYRHSSESDNQFRVEVGAVVHPGFVVDNRTYFTDQFTGGWTTRTEFGLTAETFFTPTLSAFARGAIGYQFDDDYMYGSIEFGPQIELVEDIVGTLSYTFTDSFDRNYNIRNNAYYAGVTFMLTSEFTVEIGATYVDDQVKANTYSATFNYMF